MAVRIDFQFTGWIQNHGLDHVYEPASGDTIFFGTNTTKEEVLEKLESGEWTLYNTRNEVSNGLRNRSDNYVEVSNFS
jgi:hypothetical protein